MTLRVLDLFSGIGGFSLGLERAGMRTVAFCEIEPYCRAVLRKHWPAVPCFEDVRDLHAFDVGPVDVICGGFPCQDISSAGQGIGLRGERSGLWSEYRRLIKECRPAWVIVENVSVLRSRGLDEVLGEITALGYDAEWHCIPASAVGAPHRRDRIWIIAYRNADSHGESVVPVHAEALGLPGDVAYANQPRLEGWLRRSLQERARECAAGPVGPLADTDGESLGRVAEPRGQCDRWLAEPALGRVANGVPSRVDRLRALGNAVVPQIPELIGRAILEAESVR